MKILVYSNSPILKNSDRSARGVMVIVVGNGHSEPSSNSG